MKKLSFYNILVVLLITSFSCKNLPENENDDTNSEKRISKPNKIISVEKSIDLFKQYNAIKSKVIEPELRKIYQDPDFEETQFVWYSLEEIKEYINYIEKVKKANPKYNVTGLRFYYGAYSDKQPSKEYPNQQTFFMVPTMKSSKVDRKHNAMNHIPFYIEYEKGKNPIKGDFVAIDELMLDYNKKERLQPYTKPNITGNSMFMLSMFVEKEETSLVYNEGEACPPPYPRE